MLHGRSRYERVLLIEDNDGDAVLIEALLQSSVSEPLRVHRVACLEQGAALAADEPFDVALLDLSLPDSIGEDTLRRAVTEIRDVALVVLTGTDDELLAQRAVEFGAQDYLVKGSFGGDELVRVMRYAVKRHEAVLALKRSNDELQRANDMKDDFIAIASHELRTPVTVISGAVQTMSHRWDSMVDSDRERVMHAVRRQSNRLVKLVEDLLVLSRVDRGALEPVFSDVRVDTLLEEAVDTSMASPDDVVVTTTVPWVQADGHHLTRVLVNLLDNAAKYGAPPFGLDVSSRDGGVSFTIRDHGTGVAPEFRERLFAKFTRAESESVRRQHGAGLGLAIVEALVTGMRGVVQYADAPGGGAQFDVWIPHLALLPVTTPAASSAAR